MATSNVVFIAGPTASGKSGAALALAQKTGGEIVNADAMQVYRDLRILTARPSIEDETAVPHHLYGTLDAAGRCSAGRWARMAADAIAQINARGQIAIVAGGTGLYFKALEEGLSPIPDAAPEARARAIARRAAIGPAAFHAEVIANDPAMERFPASDAQRLMRAWEVFEGTGKPLSHFQAMARTPLIGAVTAKVVIAPPRACLYANCNARAAAMFTAGAVEEVRALLARGLDPALPVMKALGVPEISAFVRGETGQEEALSTLQQNTRRFAKRQMTWFRGQATDWPRAETLEAAAEILAP